MAKILVGAADTNVPLTAADLGLLERDEPLYLGPGEMTAPPPLPPAPTLDEVARRAAQLVVEIQAAAPRAAKDAPLKSRRIRKTVVRDPVTHRITEVIEEEF
jgi:hypothetical protein